MASNYFDLAMCAYAGDAVADPAKVAARFAAYFCRNYPGPNTIIHKPEWHAPRIFRAAADAIARWGRPAIQPEANGTA
jgi:hypothetical protein